MQLIQQSPSWFTLRVDDYSAPPGIQDVDLTILIEKGTIGIINQAQGEERLSHRSLPLEKHLQRRAPGDVNNKICDPSRELVQILTGYIRAKRFGS